MYRIPFPPTQNVMAPPSGPEASMLHQPHPLHLPLPPPLPLPLPLHLQQQQLQPFPPQHFPAIQHCQHCEHCQQHQHQHQQHQHQHHQHRMLPLPQHGLRDGAAFMMPIPVPPNLPNIQSHDQHRAIDRLHHTILGGSDRPHQQFPGGVQLPRLPYSGRQLIPEARNDPRSLTANRSQQRSYNSQGYMPNGAPSSHPNPGQPAPGAVPLLPNQGRVIQSGPIRVLCIADVRGKINLLILISSGMKLIIPR